MKRQVSWRGSPLGYVNAVIPMTVPSDRRCRLRFRCLSRLQDAFQQSATRKVQGVDTQASPRHQERPFRATEQIGDTLTTSAALSVYPTRWDAFPAGTFKRCTGEGHCRVTMSTSRSQAGLHGLKQFRLASANRMNRPQPCTGRILSAASRRGDTFEPKPLS
jgi:hypothetical protein